MINRKPLYEQIVQEMISRIKQGVYSPGTLLPPEKNLMEELHVSRNTLREAMKSLSAAGILTSSSGRGTVLSEDALEKVTGSNMEMDLRGFNSVSEILELRIIIEPETAALAASRASTGQIETLEEMLLTLKAMIDGEKHWEEPGMAFHSFIAKMTGNNCLLHVLDSISESLLKTRSILYWRNIHQRISWEEHRDIYEAIKARNSESARNLMRLHLEHTRELYQF
jgi:GntR family transcriptional regulator, transcriptional repressor for pyruvate dehydrogenase complex